MATTYCSLANINKVPDGIGLNRVIVHEQNSPTHQKSNKLQKDMEKTNTALN